MSGSGVGQENTQASAVSKAEDITEGKWLSRFLKGLKRGRIPISALIIMFIVPLATGVAILAWGLTHSAALTSAAKLANSLQEENLGRISADILTRLHAMEKSVDEQKRNWAQGLFQLGDYENGNYSGKEDALMRMFSTPIPHADLYMSQHFTTMPDGEFWGINNFLNADSTRTFQLMRQYGLDWHFYVGDENDYTNRTTPWNGGALDFSWDNTANPWVAPIDQTPEPARSQLSLWIPPYVLDSGGLDGWLTFAKPIYNQTKQYIGIQGSDMAMSWFEGPLKRYAEYIPYRTATYVFGLHPDKDEIIGASTISSRELIKSAAEGNPDPAFLRLLTIPELAANASFWEPVSALYNHLLKMSDGSLYKFVGDYPKASIQLKLSNGQYIVQVEQIQTYNLNWGIVHIVSQDDILEELHTSNTKTIGTVIGVVAAGCAVGILFTYFLSKALYMITRDLVLLSDFKFTDVLQKDLDKENGMRRPKYSRIAELWQIQRAFHKMVVTFADAVAQNKRFTVPEQRRTMSMSSGPASPRSGQ
ncbi:hypothetical protein SpCBS45565_g02008 [Spizellomyces sp. 'palustris']|nr:hypothetical protein SpCBS45565_g02008 [Spizellomyces sp. 'palustris']